MNQLFRTILSGALLLCVTAATAATVPRHPEGTLRLQP
jgi:hypothetical protein